MKTEKDIFNEENQGYEVVKSQLVSGALKKDIAILKCKKRPKIVTHTVRGQPFGTLLQLYCLRRQ